MREDHGRSSAEHERQIIELRLMRTDEQFEMPQTDLFSAWIGLWFPLDQFLFFPLAYGRDSRALRLLHDADVVVSPSRPTPVAAATEARW